MNHNEASPSVLCRCVTVGDDEVAPLASEGHTRLRSIYSPPPSSDDEQEGSAQSSAEGHGRDMPCLDAHEASSSARALEDRHIMRQQLFVCEAIQSLRKGDEATWVYNSHHHTGEGWLLGYGFIPSDGIPISPGWDWGPSPVPPAEALLAAIDRARASDCTCAKGVIALLIREREALIAAAAETAAFD